MNLTNMLRNLYKLSFLILVVSVLLRIYFSNTLVSDNNRLNDLFTRKDELQKEISRLTYVENNKLFSYWLSIVNIYFYILNIFDNN